MTQHIEKICTYTISTGLVAGDWLSVLDHHAAAFGVMLGALITFMVNLVFQWINHRAIAKK